MTYQLGGESLNTKISVFQEKLLQQGLFEDGSLRTERKRGREGGREKNGHRKTIFSPSEMLILGGFIFCCNFFNIKVTQEKIQLFSSKFFHKSLSPTVVTNTMKRSTLPQKELEQHMIQEKFPFRLKSRKAFYSKFKGDQRKYTLDHIVCADVTSFWNSYATQDPILPLDCKILNCILKKKFFFFEISQK